MSYQHHIDKERCKGCGLCVSVCPKKVLEMATEINDKGYFPAYQARPEDCVFCAMCSEMCPDVAISICQVDDNVVGKTRQESTHG